MHVVDVVRWYRPREKKKKKKKDETLGGNQSLAGDDGRLIIQISSFWEWASGPFYELFLASYRGPHSRSMFLSPNMPYMVGTWEIACSRRCSTIRMMTFSFYCSPKYLMDNY